MNFLQASSLHRRRPRRHGNSPRVPRINFTFDARHFLPYPILSPLIPTLGIFTVRTTFRSDYVVTPAVIKFFTEEYIWQLRRAVLEKYFLPLRAVLFAWVSKNVVARLSLSVSKRLVICRVEISNIYDDDQYFVSVSILLCVCFSLVFPSSRSSIAKYQL